MKSISILLLALACQASCQRVIEAQPSNPGDNEPNFVTPEYILPCSRSDPALDKCIQKAFNHLRPYLIKGIPELELPSIEPLVIPQLGMENGQGAVRVKALFTNITTYGSGNYTVSKVRIDLRTLRVDLQLSIPKIEIQGRYEVNGKVLLFPIQSQGEFWARFGDVEATAQVQGVEELRDGVRYMRISRLLVDFNLGSSRFHVSDKLMGRNVIGQAMNQFLNQNAREIIEEMRPAARASIAEHFMAFLNTAFTKVPLKVWLHDT
ncbi:protein takeout-like [Chelonus insularis]|uniref:protein takeout-like n=1 Tax=Chelonus insularis TaxID=460826 RepID=UPI001588F241|nr:protein takeout-like [Chelonus insularis]